MRLKLTDKYEDFHDAEGYLTQEGIDAINAAVEGEFGSLWDIRIGDFFSAVRGDFSYIGVEQGKDLEIGQKYYIDNFKRFVEELFSVMAKLQVKQTPEQVQASSVCIPMTFEESVLIFMRQYFGLHTFKEVEDMRMSDYLIAKKDTYNTSMFNRSLTNIHKQKYKK